MLETCVLRVGFFIVSAQLLYIGGVGLHQT